MAPTYVQTRTRSACADGILIVSVVISATPIVAVRPGSAPMMTPTSDDSSTSPSVSGSEKLAMERPNATRPSNMTERLRQAHVEDLLEDERDDERRQRSARDRHDRAPQRTRFRLAPGAL